MNALESNAFPRVLEPLFMQVFRSLPPPSERRPCALTIGNFDGVHRGHRRLIERLTELAARWRCRVVY